MKKDFNPIEAREKAIALVDANIALLAPTEAFIEAAINLHRVFCSTENCELEQSYTEVDGRTLKILDLLTGGPASAQSFAIALIRLLAEDMAKDRETWIERLHTPPSIDESHEEPDKAMAQK